MRYSESNPHESLLVTLEEVQRQPEDVEASRGEPETVAQVSVTTGIIAAVGSLGDAEVRCSDLNAESRAQAKFSPEVRTALIQILMEKGRLNQEIQSITAALRGLNDQIHELIIYMRIRGSVNRAQKGPVI